MTEHEKSAETRTKTPTELRHVSTIGLPTPRKASGASAIRTPSSATGVALRQIEPADVERWAVATARQIDMAPLASLPQSLRTSLEEVAVVSYGEGGFDSKLTGYKWAADVSEEDIGRALIAIERSLEPSPRSLVAAEVLRLKTLTASRAASAEDLNVTATLYMDELQAFPPDVVVNACRYWVRNEKWWPAWSELKDILDFRMRRRLALARALREAGGA